MNPLWNEIAARANVSLSPEQHAQLSRYIELLLQANQKMNLTRIVDPAAAELQHVADSLTLLKYLPPGPIRVADIGSGGGVPGIPLAIARPDGRFLLVESTKKKAAFLQQAISGLGLTNVGVSDQRTEDVARNRKTREAFDVVVARAVATMDWLAEWCLPLVKKGGWMLAMKGPKALEELPLARHAIAVTGGSAPEIHPAELVDLSQHVIIHIRKTGTTPMLYPRPATATKGKPLHAPHSA